MITEGKTLKASRMEASAAMWQVMKDNVQLQKDEFDVSGDSCEQNVSLINNFTIYSDSIIAFLRRNHF